MRRTLLIFGFIFITITCYGTNYYVSNSGNDNNNGLTENTAWKSIDKVNAEMGSFVSGDIIMFKSGGEFFGTLEVRSKNGITITSFGTGPKPIITNAKDITGWTNEGANIWSVTEPDDVYQMFKDKSNLQNARSPYYTITALDRTNPTTKFQSNDLIGHADITDGTVMIRRQQYFLCYAKIQSFNSGAGVVTLEFAPRIYGMQAGNEFYIINSVNELSEQDEWSYNGTTLKMYSSSEPTGVRAALNDTKGIYVNASSNIDIDGLHIKEVNDHGIAFNNSFNCNAKNNQIDYAYEAGIFSTGGDNVNINNNTIKGGMYRGIRNETNNSDINYNDISEIGFENTYTYLRTWSSIGITSQGNNNNVLYNNLYNLGYLGIDFKGSYSIIRYNYIDNFCTFLYDGGAIYTYSGTWGANTGQYSKIEYNTIIGSEDLKGKTIAGVYLDDMTVDVEVKHNNITTIDRGIFLHNTKRCDIQSNTVYNMGSGIKILEDSNGGDGGTINNIVSYNKVYLESDVFTEAAFVSRSIYNNTKLYTGDNNKYFNYYYASPINIRSTAVYFWNKDFPKEYNIKNIPALDGNEINSKQNTSIVPSFTIASYNGDNTILNGDFSSGTDDWFGDNGATVSSEGGYLHLNPNGKTKTYTASNSSRITVSKGDVYLVEFDIRSKSEHEGRLSMHMTGTPYSGTTGMRPVQITTSWVSHKYLMKADFSGVNVRADFYDLTTIGFDLDNVSIRLVTEGPKPVNSYFAYNETDIQKVVSLSNGTWVDMDGKVYNGSISLEPFTSKILMLSDKTVGIINANAGEDVEICKGESTILKATGGTSYLWSNGETTESITVSPTTTTTYTVTVSDGTDTATDDVIVTVNEAIANAGTDKAITEGESVALIATGGDTYLWSTGATTASITVSPIATKTYTVTVTKNGCQDTDRVKVTVNPIIVPVTASAGSDISICNGESATLTASGGATYLWSTGATTTSITVSPSSTKTYTVTATDASGNSDSDDVIVTVNSVTANAGANVTINEGENTTLTALGGDNYSWSNGATTQSITVTPTATKGYTVTVTKNGCQDTDRVTVTVNPIIIPVTASAGADVSICNGESATLTASGGATYLWSTGATTASIAVSPSSTKTYTVTVIDGSGNTDSDDVMVTVNTVTANAGANVTINEGESTTLTALGGDTYSWSNGATTQSITVSPTATKGYTVTATKNGCQDTDRVKVTVNPIIIPVTANAGADVAICNGESTTLTASGGATYLWSTGATTTSITVIPISTKTYTVTATDGSGNSDSDDVIVTVNTVTANAGANVTINEGESTTLTASGGDTYSWSNGAATQSIIVTPTATKGYTVTVTKNGCQDTDRVTVTVNPINLPVTASAGADVTICNGESTTLTASGGATYLWSTGATSTSITISPTSTKTYTVTATDGSGNSDSDDVIVTVNSVTANAGANVTITEGESTILTATGGDTYSWSNGAITQSITVSPADTKGYTVTVTKNGCQDTDRVTVTVDPITIPTTVTANAGADVSICTGESTTLTASGGATYLWSTGATTASITVSPNTTKTYTVTATDGSGNSDSDDVIVSITSVTADAGEDKMINTGQTVKLTASGGDTYLWSTGQTTKSITVTPSTTKDYTVTVYQNGCQETDEIIVFVAYDITNPPPADAFAGDDMSICLGETVTLNASGGDTYTWSTGDANSNIDVNPTRTTTYTLSATRGGITDTDTVTVSVENCNISALPEDVSVSEISIYPNPTSDIVNINVPDLSSDMNVELISSNGSLVYKETIYKKSNGFYKIDLSRRLAKGVYFVRLFNADQYFIEKIILN